MFVCGLGCRVGAYACLGSDRKLQQKSPTEGLEVESDSNAGPNPKPYTTAERSLGKTGGSRNPGLGFKVSQNPKPQPETALNTKLGSSVTH